MGFDLTRHYVRILGERDGGLVEFEFAVGEPDLVVELIMPRPAFAAFCAIRQVEFLAPPSAPAALGPGTPDAAYWHLRDVTRQRIA